MKKKCSTCGEKKTIGQEIAEDRYQCKKCESEAFKKISKTDEEKIKKFFEEYKDQITIKDIEPGMKRKKCSLKWCSTVSYKNFLCKKHFMQANRTGHVTKDDKEPINIPGEEWKPINYADGYFISSFGRVKKMTCGKTIIIKQSIVNSRRTGLKSIIASIVYNNGKRMPLRLHRCVAQHFFKEYKSKCLLLYKDGNPLNIRVDNIELLSNARKEKTKEALKNNEDDLSKQILMYMDDKENNLSDYFLKEFKSVENIIKYNLRAIFPDGYDLYDEVFSIVMERASIALKSGQFLPGDLRNYLFKISKNTVKKVKAKQTVYFKKYTCNERTSVDSGDPFSLSDLSLGNEYLKGVAAGYDMHDYFIDCIFSEVSKSKSMGKWA